MQKRRRLRPATEIRDLRVRRLNYAVLAAENFTLTKVSRTMWVGEGDRATYIPDP